jgi:hypothetical protein
LRHLARIRAMMIRLMMILLMMIGPKIRYRHLRSHQYSHRSHGRVISTNDRPGNEPMG